MKEQQFVSTYSDLVVNTAIPINHYYLKYPSAEDLVRVLNCLVSDCDQELFSLYVQLLHAWKINPLYSSMSICTHRNTERFREKNRFTDLNRFKVSFSIQPVISGLKDSLFEILTNTHHCTCWCCYPWHRTNHSLGCPSALLTIHYRHILITYALPATTHHTWELLGFVKLEPVAWTSNSVIYLITTWEDSQIYNNTTL